MTVPYSINTIVPFNHECSNTDPERAPANRFRTSAGLSQPSCSTCSNKKDEVKSFNGYKLREGSQCGMDGLQPIGTLRRGTPRHARSLRKGGTRPRHTSRHFPARMSKRGSSDTPTAPAGLLSNIRPSLATLFLSTSTPYHPQSPPSSPQTSIPPLLFHPP